MRKAKLTLLNVRYGSLKDDSGNPIRGSFHSRRIEENRAVMEFLSGQLRTLNDRTADMERVFGKNPTSFRSEFFYYIWPFDFKGYTWFVLTGKRGTSFEVLAAELYQARGHLRFRQITWRFLSGERFGRLAIEFIKRIQDELVPY